MLVRGAIADSDSSDGPGSGPKPWIDVFFDQPSSDWFCRVPLAFTSDGLNTFGLRIDPNHAKSAYMQLVGSVKGSDSYDSDSEDEIEKCTERLFGLVHARYIFTQDGITEMAAKYESGVFGYCPRFLCKDQHLLPLGLTDFPGCDTVKVYCPRCRQIYEPDDQHAHLDGAFFTRSFAHYFLIELKNLRSPRPESMPD
jgi:casein kinase II subunit beta